MAADCGLTGPLGLVFRPAGANGFAFIAALLERQHDDTILAWDIPRTHTALVWFSNFLRAGEFPTPYSVFVPALELAGQVCNRAILDAFVTFVRRSPSLKKTRSGGSVSADVAASYGSAIHLLRSREARYDIAPACTNLNMSLATRTWRRDDGYSGDRQLCRALRAADLVLAASRGFDRTSPQGIIDWAGLLNAHNMLWRGGEWGLPDDIVGDPRRIISWNSIEWQEPRVESKGRPWIFFHLFKIKDVEAKSKPYPTPLARRHDGAFGADPLCPYDATALAWWSRRAPVGVPFPVDALGRPAPKWWADMPVAASAPRPTSPFFTVNGDIYTTTAVRLTVRRVAEACGFDPSEYGAKSPRSGGATDWRAQAGDTSAGLVKARGRWCSDVALIYQRDLASTQLELSAAVGSVVSADLESLSRGWVQPTR